MRMTCENRVGGRSGKVSCKPARPKARAGSANVNEPVAETAKHGGNEEEVCGFNDSAPAIGGALATWPSSLAEGGTPANACVLEPAVKAKGKSLSREGKPR